ncbi:MAG: Crp/Fnr family transcriptional regulator [Proteobacteria bacterium]|nr:Crp/Fnr family transcriptional regulator [Pseudomonadota bacterium]
MDRDEGLRILTERGWLNRTPPEFRQALLPACRWYHLEPGAMVQAGDEAVGELIGLASGCLEMRTTLGPSDTPVMHLEHPVFWIGYGPILAGQPRNVAATARTHVSLASVPHATVMRMLEERPDWWRHLLPLAWAYGDTVVAAAADLVIRSSERRCAAVLLRLSGLRTAGSDDLERHPVPLSQDELAAAANMSRNTAGTALRKLKAGGMVEIGYRGVVVRDPVALRRFVDAG